MNETGNLTVSKRVNSFFLILIILHLLASILLSTLFAGAVEISVFSSLLITQLMILIPSFVFLLIFNCDVFEWVSLKKLNPVTALLVVLFTFLIMPVITVVNLASQLFTTNTAIEMSAEFTQMPSLLIIFMVGIFGPVCEEFTFRGVIYGGYKKTGFIPGAAFLSSLYFGLMHLNINQFCYAVLIGIFACYMIEATGSILSSMIMHAVINTWNVMLMLVMDKAYKAMGLNLTEIATSEITQDYKLGMIGVSMVVALVAGALAFGVYIVICKREGTLDKILEVKKETGTRLLTFSGWLAIIICVFVIFFLDKVMALLNR
ncbi:MAG: CPBP family intramembrane metalloprotease [Lachnospiraceae bacterium]|nr:CPBP family intramembrane metalloprotease [Lachnospiraceae bacterium]